MGNIELIIKEIKEVFLKIYDEFDYGIEYKFADFRCSYNDKISAIVFNDKNYIVTLDRNLNCELTLTEISEKDLEKMKMDYEQWETEDFEVEYDEYIYPIKSNLNFENRVWYNIEYKFDEYKFIIKRNNDYFYVEYNKDWDINNISIFLKDRLINIHEKMNVLKSVIAELKHCWNDAIYDTYLNM